MFEGLKKITQILSYKDRLQISFFSLLLFLSTILEGLSLGAVYPLIKFSISAEGLNSFNHYLNNFDISYNFEQIEIIYYLSVFILIAFFLRFLFSIYFIYWKSNFLHNLGTDLNNRLYKKLVYEDYNFFKKNNSSILIRSFFYDVTFLVKAINSSLRILLEGLALIIILIILTIISPKITIITGFLFLTIFFTFNKIISEKIKIWADSKQSLTSTLIKTLQETVGKIKNILIEQNQNFFENRYDKRIKKFNFFSKKLMFFQELPRPILEFITVLIICVSILIFNFSEKIENFLPLLAIFGVAAMRIMPALSRISSLKQVFDSSLPSVKSLNKFYMSNNLMNFISSKKKTESNSFNHSIELKDISYKHMNSNKYIHKNFNLKINKQDFICIYGKSGVGKTTLIDIISGLLKPSEGQIFIDGKKCDFNNPNWKQTISYIPQTTYLLNDSIKNNIIFGEDHDTEKFDKVIQDSQLSSFINSLPNKEETEIGEDGSLISVGEKQRIGIARALYLERQILICDEITSALDVKTSENILNCLKNISKEKTIIFISHNQEVISAATRKVPL